MTGNQMMDCYVWPWHIYLHSRTCTRSSLRRRISILMAFHVCYLIDHASTYDISSLMTKFQCTSWCLYSVWRPYFTVYCMWQWPLMTYVYYAYSLPLYCYVFETAMYTSYLQFCVEIYHCIILMSGRFFHLYIHYSTPWTIIMYFGHCTSLTSHIKGHLL